MAKILKFFEQRKLDRKFKRAGEGKSLNSSGGSEQKPEKSAESKSVPRSKPNDCSARAGAAALARMEADAYKSKTPNWSLSAIRNQAKKELEDEQLAIQSAKSEPKDVVQDCSPVLAVTGVYFSCPLIGPDVLQKQDMRAKIKEFLYEQMAEEKALTACLLIHTVNDDREKVKVGIEIIGKYLRNIIENPEEEKYRRIRLENKVFREKVSSLEGALDFLIGAGFVNQVIEISEGKKEEFLVFTGSSTESIDFLSTLIEALQNSEPIVPVLDRNVRVLMPSQALARVTLPNDFFNLTVDELKREQERRTAEVELNSCLRTKEMREREAVRELSRYRYTLMRIRFPDGIILQGTFSVKEKLYKVYEFVTEHLASQSLMFNLLAPGGFKLTEADLTLRELHLVPAALLTLAWVEGESSSSEAFLRPDTIALLQPLETDFT